MDDLTDISPDRLEEFINSGGLDQIKSPATAEVESVTPVAATQGTQAQDIQSPAPEMGNSLAFDIKDPVELLYLLDPDLRSGRIALHAWQVQFLMDFAKEWTQEKPFQSIVRACNGSGKDKYLVAPCAVWLCMRYQQSRVVITSSSGVQLDNQTDAYVKQLCLAANNVIHPDIWKCNYRYYECLPTRSPMVLFATDEAGKAEGYHPFVFGAKMALFESEAKTVPDDIHYAMSRCTGYTHRCMVSTPGLPVGHMYDLDSTSVDRKSLEHVEDISETDYIRYHVTSYDCSHIPRADIERDKRNLPGGETGAAFKSKHLADYGTTDEMVVVPYTYVWRSYNSVPREGHITEPHNKGGLDLSDGGDETVLVVRNGNKLLKVLPFRFDNTEDTIAFLNEKFREYELTQPEAYVYADCGGLGKPILDRLRRQGWSNIRYFDNRAAAYEPRVYRNRGAESWFHIRKLLERHEIILYRDDRLIRQLSTRYYKLMGGTVHQLLSKLESRSRGYPSPDRADALVLAFCDYKSTKSDTVEAYKPPFHIADPVKPKSEFTLNEWAASEIKGKWNRNPSQNKDFSLLREDIERYNELIRSNKPAETV